VTNTDELPGAAYFVRWLARQGNLKGYAQSASMQERRRLWAGACEIAWPLVFNQVTRRVERKRGHFMCATAVQRLEPDCLDRFHDDVEAVVDDLFANADLPIQNLEGWLTMRLHLATVNGHRRRRGERGAPQRPRVPVWLGKALGADPWLTELAKAILEWAGVEATAGTQLWPLNTWAERRAEVTGDHLAGEAALAADIDVVLTAMQRRPTWFEKNVERPLGRKQAPVWLAPTTPRDGEAEPEPLVLVARHEMDDALLRELAAAAIDTLRHRVRRGDGLKEAVVEVVETMFGALPAAHDLDRIPGAGPVVPERAVALINDPAALERIMTAVLGLLSEEDHD
jgi:hypothetical protein